MPATTRAIYGERWKTNSNWSSIMAHKRPTPFLLLDSTTWAQHITPRFIGLYRPWRCSIHTPMMPIFLHTHAISWWLSLLLLRETHSPMALVVQHSRLPSSNATTTCDSILTETNLLLNKPIQNVPARHPGLMRPNPWRERVHMHADTTHTMHARHTRCMPGTHRSVDYWPT
jgi:hypothetical protein